MKRSRKIRIVVIALFCLALTALIYAYSFEAVQPVCKNQAQKEVFLLNYVSKKQLKQTVYSHNKGFIFKGNEYTRLYLLHYIYELPDPIWDSNIDYSKNGCETINNMDIYCEVRYTKLPDGTINAWYNFME